MITGFFNKLRKSKDKGTSPQIPDGQRIYCIGDIHGRADLLRQLHETILSDAADYKGKKTVVYLGDYIDRGEQSREVIEILLSEPLAGFKTVYLQGNHEQWLLNFLDYPVEGSAWLSFGGREMLSSYGIPLAHIPTQSEIPTLAEQLRQALPEAHKNFFKDCQACWQCGPYYFVHAGICPGVALEKQVLEDQLWIRDEFLDSKKDHGAIIVHAHNVTLEPQFLPNRIGIDTGAFSSGILTCLVLESDKQSILQT